MRQTQPRNRQGEPDYKVDRFDSTPLPDQGPEDPFSLSGAGGAGTEFMNKVKLGCLLFPLTLGVGFGLRSLVGGVLHNSNERRAAEEAAFYDHDLLEERRDYLMTSKGEIIEFKKNFAALEKPTTSEIAAFERERLTREKRWKLQVVSYNDLRKRAIKTARKIGETEDDFPKAIAIDLEIPGTPKLPSN